MKKVIILAAIGLALALTSCRSNKAPCPAYRVPRNASIDIDKNMQKNIAQNNDYYIKVESRD